MIDNLADGSTLNGKKTLALRGTVRWQPTAQTTVDVIANWQRDQPPGTAFKSGVIPTSAGNTDPFQPAQLNRGRALGLDRTVGGVTAIVEHALSKTWSLTSTTGWREFDAYENFDADGARIYLLEFAEDARGRQFSQEVRANFNDGGRFSGFVGASYFRETGSTRVPFYTDEGQLWPFLEGTFRGTLIAGGLPAALVNLALPPSNPFARQATLPLAFAAFNNPLLPPQLRGLAALAGAPLRPYRADEYTQSGSTRATDLFADGTWRVTDQLELTAGLRFTRESITSGYEVINGTPAPTLGFIVNAIPGYPYLPSGGKRTARDTASSWDGRGIARYAFSKTLSAYAGMARGHRPSGLLVSSTATEPVREEKVINYEAGLKGSVAGGRLQWSASAYHYDYAHFQTAVLSLGRFSIVNAGNATGRGLEFGLQGRITNHTTVFANYAYTSATFDDTSDTGDRQAYAGNTFRLTPRNAYSVGGTFVLPIEGPGRFFITPIWSFKSAHYFEDNNASFNYSLKQGGYGIANLRAGWRSPQGRWEIVAHGENIFDRRFLIDAGNTGGSFGIPTFVAGNPRRLGVQASVRW